MKVLPLVRVCNTYIAEILATVISVPFAVWSLDSELKITSNPTKFVAPTLRENFYQYRMSLKGWNSGK
ncbi:MAG: hypothetical protein JNL75_09430 [Chitinophagales bacterium]|nr:hypothetical protein [Chitinophagales bacterium]